MSISLKSFHVPKESMGYTKKEEKRKYPCQKSMRKKSMTKNMNNPMLKSMKKKSEKKKERKIAHTFK